MIDADGFRANVGIILCNDERRVFWGRRVGRGGWQFPQGGIRAHETPERAMYRELHEEIGLRPEQVEVLGRTREWLQYRLPEQFQRRGSEPRCVGQKQQWFLLRFLGEEQDIAFDSTEVPEFDEWRWVDYWAPVDEVIFFKRAVYRQALEELAPLLAESARRGTAS